MKRSQRPPALSPQGCPGGGREGAGSCSPLGPGPPCRCTPGGSARPAAAPRGPRRRCRAVPVPVWVPVRVPVPISGPFGAAVPGSPSAGPKTLPPPPAATWRWGRRAERAGAEAAAAILGRCRCGERPRGGRRPRTPLSPPKRPPSPFVARSGARPVLCMSSTHPPFFLFDSTRSWSAEQALGSRSSLPHSLAELVPHARRAPSLSPVY